MRWLVLASLMACSAGAAMNSAPAQSPETSPGPCRACGPAYPSYDGSIWGPDARAAMPAPYRARGAEAVALNATCEGCHAPEAAEWRGSMHRAAFTNRAFQAAYAVESTAFCSGCHAPEGAAHESAIDAAAGTAGVAGESARIGVACVSCHVTRAGVVLSANPNPRPAPHAVERSADFARTGGCAGCHEFSFPAATARDDAHMMQTTLREHARSPASAAPCAACHMRESPGRRSHAFAEVRDRAWLAARLRVDAATAGHMLAITLTQTTPGHAFPTGDLFRRLAVIAETRDSNGRVLGKETRYLTRHFETIPGRGDRVAVDDNRVFDEPVRVELPISSGGTSVAWSVVQQRVAGIASAAAPENATIESEVLLHSGTVNP